MLVQCESLGFVSSLQLLRIHSATEMFNLMVHEIAKVCTLHVRLRQRSTPGSFGDDATSFLVRDETSDNAYAEANEKVKKIHQHQHHHANNKPDPCGSLTVTVPAVIVLGEYGLSATSEPEQLLLSAGLPAWKELQER